MRITCQDGELGFQGKKRKALNTDVNKWDKQGKNGDNNVYNSLQPSADGSGVKRKDNKRGVEKNIAIIRICSIKSCLAGEDLICYL